MRIWVGLLLAGDVTCAAPPPGAAPLSKPDGTLSVVRYWKRLIVTHVNSDRCPIYFDAGVLAGSGSPPLTSVPASFAAAFSRGINRFAQREDNLCLNPEVGAGHGPLGRIRLAELVSAPTGSLSQLMCTGADNLRLVAQALDKGHHHSFSNMASSTGEESLQFLNQTGLSLASPVQSPEARAHCAVLAARLELAKDILKGGTAAEAGGEKYPEYRAEIADELKLNAAGNQCAISFFGIAPASGKMDAQGRQDAKTAFQDQIALNPQGMCFGVVHGTGLATPSESTTAKVIKNAKGKPVLECSQGDKVVASYVLPVTHTAGSPLPTFPSTASVIAAAAGGASKAGGFLNGLWSKKPTAQAPSGAAITTDGTGSRRYEDWFSGIKVATTDAQQDIALKYCAHLIHMRTVFGKIVDKIH